MHPSKWLGNLSRILSETLIPETDSVALDFQAYVDYQTS